MDGRVKIILIREISLNTFRTLFPLYIGEFFRAERRGIMYMQNEALEAISENSLYDGAWYRETSVLIYGSTLELFLVQAFFQHSFYSAVVSVFFFFFL